MAAALRVLPTVALVVFYCGFYFVSRRGRQRSNVTQRTPLGLPRTNSRRGGSHKPPAFTATKAPGTPTPETATTAGCSSSPRLGTAWGERVAPRTLARPSSFTAHGSSGTETADLGANGELPGRAV